MKKIITLSALITTIVVSGITFYSCVSPRIAEKGGAQLWGENCLRCHNSPSPSSFSDKQWEAVGMHMQIRANLTHQETEKIIEFLKSAN